MHALQFWIFREILGHSSVFIICGNNTYCCLKKGISSYSHVWFDSAFEFRKFIFSRGIILSYHILVYYVIFPDCASEHTSSLFWKISKSDGILKLTYLVFKLFKKSVFLFIRVPGTCSHASEKSWKMSQIDRGKYI